MLTGTIPWREGMIHPAYDFRFSNGGELRQQRAAIGMRRDLGGRIVVVLTLQGNLILNEKM